MASFHWERTSAVPADKAREWFFDLREDDHDTPRHVAARGGKPPAPGDGRKILSRSPDTVVTQDTWDGGRNSMRFTLKKSAADALTMDGEGMGGKLASHATMRFVPTAEGSRLDMDTEFKAAGLMGLVMPLFMGRFKKTIAEDMAMHVEEMEEEWKRKPW